MQRLRHFLSFKRLACLSILLSLVFFINSCRKDNTNTSFDEAKASARFFAYPASVDTNIKQIAKEIERQNNQYHFLQYFIDNNGYPTWDKYQMAASGIGTVAIIPFSFDAQQKTNGFIICRKSADSQFSFELYKKDFLLSYSFTQRDNDSLNAMQVQSMLNKFNYDNFGITTYHIADYRMLPDSIIKNHPQEIDPTKLTGHIRPPRKQKSETAMLATTCYTYYSYTDWWWSPSGADDVNEPGAYYAYTTYDANTICYDNGGGGTSYGGSSTTTQWWTGGGGGGGGNGSPPPPPPPPVRDSNYFKGLLNKYTVAISKMSDSAFKLGVAKNIEYAFVITEKSNNIYTRNFKTDTLPDAITIKYISLPAGEALKGGLHIHWGTKPGDPPEMRTSLDIVDVDELWNYGHINKQDYISIVELGDVRQAIVVEDPVKAQAFINHLDTTNFTHNWYNIANSKFTGNNWRQATLQATISMLGNSSISGIGFYQTISADKLLFTKLN